MKMTGVGAVLSAAHRDRETGTLHGHTWEVTAWVVAGRSALPHQDLLRIAISKLDHRELPTELAWGEDIAEWIADEMTLAGAAVLMVEVNRPAERIYAKWFANGFPRR